MNRSAEVQLLDAWLDESGERGVLVSVGGSGGVGKTAFGAWWLQRHHHRFAGGHLYADLGAGSSDEPVSTAEVLGGFLRSLGVVSEHIPVELGERAALYRSITADRELAVLLDNAVSAAQVRPLFPNSVSSVVVVTSRVRLAGLALDGACFLDLAPLNAEDAVGMLSRVLGRSRVDDEPDSARALVHLCSGFPLALAVVGARLLTHPSWSLSRLVEQLRDERRRLSALSLAEDVSLQSVFDATYRDLSGEAARLYRLLAVCPGEDYPLELVNTLWEADRDAADSWMSELVEANLVTEPEQGRFRYHDLLAVHARQLSEVEDSESERDRVRRRTIEWYLDRAVEADLVVNPRRRRLGPRYRRSAGPPAFSSAEQALDWCERERRNLLGGLWRADQQGWDDLCWQWCEVMWSFFLYRKWYSDWISSHRRGIEAAARCGQALAESRLRRQLAFAYLDLRQFDSATEVCEPALGLAEAEGDADSISTALSQLAKAARGRGDLHQAWDYLQRAVRLADESGDRRGYALRLRTLARVLADQGDDEQAVDSLRRSVAVFGEIGDERGRARALTDLGRVFLRSGDTEEAGVALRTALPIMRASGSPVYQADVLVELGDLADARGDAMMADRYLREAEQQYRSAAHPRAEEIQHRLADPESADTPRTSWSFREGP